MTLTQWIAVVGISAGLAAGVLGMRFIIKRLNAINTKILLLRADIKELAEPEAVKARENAAWHDLVNGSRNDG